MIDEAFKGLARRGNDAKLTGPLGGEGGRRRPPRTVHDLTTVHPDHGVVGCAHHKKVRVVAPRSAEGRDPPAPRNETVDGNMKLAVGEGFGERHISPEVGALVDAYPRSVVIGRQQHSGLFKTLSRRGDNAQSTNQRWIGVSPPCFVQAGGWTDPGRICVGAGRDQRVGQIHGPAGIERGASDESAAIISPQEQYFEPIDRTLRRADDKHRRRQPNGNHPGSGPGNRRGQQRQRRRGRVG